MSEEDTSYTTDYILRLSFELPTSLTSIVGLVEVECAWNDSSGGTTEGKRLLFHFDYFLLLFAGWSNGSLFPGHGASRVIWGDRGTHIHHRGRCPPNLFEAKSFTCLYFRNNNGGGNLWLNMKRLWTENRHLCFRLPVCFITAFEIVLIPFRQLHLRRIWSSGSMH